MDCESTCQGYGCLACYIEWELPRTMEASIVHFDHFVVLMELCGVAELLLDTSDLGSIYSESTWNVSKLDSK